MTREQKATRIGWSLILAILLVIGAIFWAQPQSANASVATQLQNARDALANCQLLDRNSSGEQRQRARACITDKQRIIQLLTTTQSTPSTSPSTSPPTATPSISPTAPITTAPPSSTNNCAPNPSACGFPDASNTGIPAGTVLSAFSGNITAGQVITGKDLGCRTIDVPNVTIRNSRMSGQCLFVIRSNSSGLVIQDSEISCANSTGMGIAGRGFVGQRLEITGCENGLSMDADATISDSFIHGMYIANGGHTDGIQVYAEASNIWILHNTIFNENNGGTSAIIADTNQLTNINIQGNLLAGGAYTLYCPTKASGPVINNRISKLYKAQGGQYGPWIHCELASPRTGNVWDDTGAALPF